MPKPYLSTQEFIFRAATEVEFREKYLTNIELLAKDYEVSHVDLESLKRIDAKKLEKDLSGIKSTELLNVGAIFNANHCKDSHIDHSKEGHTNNSHSKGCDDVIKGLVEHVVLPEALAARAAAPVKPTKPVLK
jgi:hypothetical protein